MDRVYKGKDKKEDWGTEKVKEKHDKVMKFN